MLELVNKLFLLPFWKKLLY